MTDYDKVNLRPSESKVQKEEEVKPVRQEKPQAVIQNAKPKKKSLTQRFITLVTPEDGFDGLAKRVVRDVIIPGAKDLGYNVTDSLIRSILFKERIDYGSLISSSVYNAPSRFRQGRTGSGRGTTYGGTNYSNISTNNRKRQTPGRNRHLSGSYPDDSYYAVEDVFISIEDASGRVNMQASVREANKLLETLEADIRTYGFISVGTYYAFAGMDNVRVSFADEKNGWTDISKAQIKKVRDGALIIMPEPEALSTY